MFIEETLEKFLDEDIGQGDITTDALVDSKLRATGQVVCKERAIIAGLSESIILLKLLGCEGKSKVRDGQEVSAGTIILEVDGSGSSLLKVERVLLNLLSHMSGVPLQLLNLSALQRRMEALRELPARERLFQVSGISKNEQ